jgi:hypothetical protein
MDSCFFFLFFFVTRQAFKIFGLVFLLSPLLKHLNKYQYSLRFKYLSLGYIKYV